MSIAANANMPLISVITVVYNGYNEIEETMLSLLQQTYKNVEYIVIDGGSKDNTVAVIEKYQHSIAYWISEPDKGIYDAMNKGIAKATGDLINFLNVGDTYMDNRVLEDVAAEWLQQGRPDLLYGNSWIRYEDGVRKRIKAGTDVSEQWKGPVFRHGAMFAKAELPKEYPFRLESNYRICADFDFIYHMQSLGKRFQYFDRDVLVFKAEGVSDNYVRGIKDNRMVVLSYTPNPSYRKWYARHFLRGRIVQVCYKPAKSVLYIGAQFLRHYVANNIIPYIPSYKIRHFYYRKICRIIIEEGASIHMRAFITGKQIRIGKNTVINRSCYLDGRDELTIGENVSISPYVHIITGSHNIDAKDFHFISKPVVIEDYVWIGSRATILPGVRIGKGAVVAVGSVVTADVPPFTVVGGIPARKIKERSQDLNYNPSWFSLFD
ncbi:acetyltransferase-like isoleucine patch superfamily enzyme [Chitinophaga terrae (ex Kim and Jung 2007)]|uniref:glycosyltransferase n=1 Tax=Chitinophaga terrae (ex Kim and Jung 2007) TaxID=408074 RepID=UPI0027863C92|nr:glycosyltransferase [Chitinophaga terrae (ex Kim and Jung 2007)]MDQ0105770.1 acetyltransferase-like isoleucine patch superfamily enzyme [Chitinophaga terrae (ex Kim and Jung 2007)]